MTSPAHDQPLFSVPYDAQGHGIDYFDHPAVRARRDEVLPRLGELQEKLGYHFKNPALLEAALANSSSTETHTQERLANVGSAALQLAFSDIISFQPELILNHFPEHADEGALTIAKQQFHNQQSLCDIAQGLELMRYSIDVISYKERLISDEVPATLMQALIGAIWLDMNEPTRAQAYFRDFIRTHFPRIDFEENSKTILENWRSRTKGTLSWQNEELQDGSKLVWLKVRHHGKTLYKTPDYLPARSKRLLDAEMQAADRAYAELVKMPEFLNANPAGGRSR